MDFWELEVTDIHNLRLPDILVPMPENIDCVEALTLFNETCQAVRHFDEVQMKQLAMVVEFTGFSSPTEVTSLAKLLGEFEVNPFVHNDEEYGKYMVEESGLFDVDELLLPHINYASFAADKRQGTLVTSGYVEDGFVGATRELSEYQQYNGEFADPLEIDESCYETFQLYSPLTAGLYEEGFEQGKLYRSDLTPYAEEIAEAIEKECLVSSSLLLVLCIVFSFCIKCNWLLFVFVVLSAVSLVSFSPLENENRMLSREEQICYKKITAVIVVIFVIVDLLLFLLHLDSYMICISIGLLLSAGLQFPCILKKLIHNDK